MYEWHAFLVDLILALCLELVEELHEADGAHPDGLVAGKRVEVEHLHAQSGKRARDL